MIPMKRFVERCAVVTGGASGIGLAISERLLAEGARFAVWDMDSARLQELKHRFGAAVVTAARTSPMRKCRTRGAGVYWRTRKNRHTDRKCRHYRAECAYLGVSDRSLEARHRRQSEWHVLLRPGAGSAHAEPGLWANREPRFHRWKRRQS